MKIGQEFVIVNVAPYNLFTGHNSKVPKFKKIKITEEVKVRQEYTDKTITGYLAVDEDGTIYGYNYPTGGIGFGTTPWVKYISKEDFKELTEEEKDTFVEDFLWSDVTNYQCPPTPKLVEQFDILKYCEKHQSLYYSNCLYCKCKLEGISEMSHRVDMSIDLEQYKWVGWY